MAVINGTTNDDTLKGGAGNDIVTGFAGHDLVSMGGGNDVFVWNFGHGNDTVQGGAGFDTLRLTASESDDWFTLSANGSWANLLNSAFFDDTDLKGVERIDLRLGEGGDSIDIKDLSATDVKQVTIDLAGSTPGVFDSGTDTVYANGTGGNDTITMALASGRVSVTGLPVQVTIANAEAESDYLDIDGAGGNDVIDGSKLPAGAMYLDLYGGDGNDRLTGNGSDDWLEGENGDDTIIGGRGNDTVWGDGGNDLVIWNAGDGSDKINGHMGIDTLRLTGSKSKESLTIAASIDSIVVARDGLPQVIAEDVERFQIRTLAGSDTVTINNLSGSDVQRIAIDLAATAGGALADSNTDTVNLLGSSYNDTVDISWTGSAVRVAGLSAEIDIAHAGAKDVLKVTGGDGNDVLNAAGLPAGKMSLQLLGEAGDDTIFGSAGSDLVIGGIGNDVAYLGAGNDRFVWDFGAGLDKVDGQTGFDTLQFNASGNDDAISITGFGDRTFALHNGATGVELDNVEAIRVQCGLGADSIGLSELDQIDVKQVAIDLGASGGTGDNKADTIQALAGISDDHISIALSDGAVSVTGLPIKLTITHAEAIDTMQVDGGQGNDVINAATLPASAMALTLTGWDGNDTITGNAGANVLGGDNGNDTLRGGRGDDTITGGAGSDTFRYTSVLDGHDIILDFDGDATGGQDTLNLDALFDALGIANGSRAGRVDLTDNGGTVEIKINADGLGGNGFELHVATLHTVDTISVGQDIVVS